MRIVQTKNGNIVVTNSNGDYMLITTNKKKYLNDDELKSIIDKQLERLQK